MPTLELSRRDTDITPGLSLYNEVCKISGVPEAEYEDRLVTNVPCCFWYL